MTVARVVPSLLLIGVLTGCQKPAAPPAGEAAQVETEKSQAAAPATETAKPQEPKVPAVPDSPTAVAELERIGCVLTKNAEGNAVRCDCKPAEITDEQAKHLEGLPSLEHLSLENSNLTNEGLAVVAKLVTLKSLNLRRCNQLTDEALVHLEKLPQLQQLVLLFTNFTDAAMPSVGKIKSLRALDLRGCMRMGDGALEAIKGLENLVDLKVRTNSVTDAGLAHLAGLKLRTFSIEDANQITNAGFVHFSGMHGMTNLNLMRVRISDDALKNFENCKNLRDVRLRGTSVDGSGLSYLQGSKDTLKYLDLSETAFGSHAMDNLVPFTNLETLDLWFATINDDDLARLSVMTKLKELNLEQCIGVTSAGVEHLTKLPTLEVLNLKETRIDDAALESLAKLTGLKKLDLRNTPVSDEALETFQAAVPGCKVQY